MRWITLSVLLFIMACGTGPQEAAIEQPVELPEEPYVLVLGIAQDAGYPQADCKKDCCKDVWKDPSLRKMVSCIAVVSPSDQKAWMIDATPDFKNQLKLLQDHNPTQQTDLAGIFLTHAHIGHYTGLMHLGREAMGAKEMPVFAMPRMSAYLTNDGPWSQLVSLKNIVLNNVQPGIPVTLTEELSIQPFLVPHRDEYSETVGYEIRSKSKNALFIPDIDKWEKWDQSIVEVIREVEYAFIDGSFYANGEIPGRDMSQIPHPFVSETMELLDHLPGDEKSKVHFIHLNHTNPILNSQSPESKHLKDSGYHAAEEKRAYPL